MFCGELSHAHPFAYVEQTGATHEQVVVPAGQPVVAQHRPPFGGPHFVVFAGEPCCGMVQWHVTPGPGPVVQFVESA